jgi:hypothetical protein
VPAEDHNPVLGSNRSAPRSRLGRPDGSQLRVECYGREDAPPIILTHGWGANSTEWDYLKEELADRVSAYCLGLAWTGTVHANEPAFAVAMEIAGLEMDPWNDSEGMATAINM